ncbi:putative guanine nucleotide-binding protein [Toxoplasma gondii VEG]|uniref:Putative guanine nucleotide-binding protein n=1 Tax=Toxoplasma gondii (strain ATCC 50861 / VEG) TaxID=432359 RepID=B9QMJ7_TOXGV|nr:putative guanine nucleotide-binding protein [Toxoplasma gondii VEG]CEL78745.1 TPA: WD40 repeat containing protein [Toxoplasma gondii VEG]
MACSASSDNSFLSGNQDAVPQEPPCGGTPVAEALAHSVDCTSTHLIPATEEMQTEPEVNLHTPASVLRPESSDGETRKAFEKEPLGECLWSANGEPNECSSRSVEARETAHAVVPVGDCLAEQVPSAKAEMDRGVDGEDSPPSTTTSVDSPTPHIILKKRFALVGLAEAAFRAPLASSDEEDLPAVSGKPDGASRCFDASPETTRTSRRRARPCAAGSSAPPSDTILLKDRQAGWCEGRRFLHRSSSTQQPQERPAKPRKTGNENCLRGTAWSVDGSAFLTWSEDAVVRLFATPEEDTSERAEGFVDVPALDPWTCADEGELIFDCLWFPSLDWTQPRTYSYAVTSRDHPIHLYSGIDCSLLASYSCYNHLDEVAHAYSLLFHRTKPRLFAGGISGVRIFDLERPGRQLHDILFATRRAKHGQKGIISCMDFKASGPGANKLFACGSYSQSVCVYTEDCGGRRGALPYTAPTHCLLDTATSWGGVTQVKFVGENLLVSGHRQDGVMRCWDLRKPDTPLARLGRATTQSSQKFAFDSRPLTDEDEGEITALVTGDELGQISFFSLSSWKCIYAHANAHHGDHINPAAVVAAAFHPRRSLLLTAAGSRRFHDFAASTCSSPAVSPDPSDVSDIEEKYFRGDRTNAACLSDMQQSDGRHQPLRDHSSSEVEREINSKKKRRTDCIEEDKHATESIEEGCSAKIWQWGY